MLAQDIHIGRLRATSAKVAGVAVSDGGGAARAFLTLLFVAVIALEASTADPLLTFGTYLHRGLESWTPVPLPLMVTFTVPVAAVMVKARLVAPVRPGADAVRV